MKKRLLTSTFLVLTALFALPVEVWGQTTVSEYKSWDFSSQSESITTISEQDGLYIHGGSDSKHDIQFKTGQSQKITLTDGTQSNTSTTFAYSEGQTTSPSTTTAANATSIDRCFAFKTGIAGTCYATVRFYGNSNDEKKLSVFFDGVEKASYSSTKSDEDKNLHELKVTADKGGTFYIKGDAAYMVAAIKFVPTLTSNPWVISVNTYDSGITSGQYVNGLYLNPKSNHTIAFSDYKVVTNFKDATTYSIGRKVTVEGAFSSGEDPIANAMNSRRLANANMSYDYVAFDVAEAGTAYAIVKTNNSNATEGRAFRLGFQAADKSYTYKNKASSATPTEIQQSNTGPGTYFLYGSEKMDIIAIRFVAGAPKYEVVADATEHGTVTIKNGDAVISEAAYGSSISVVTTAEEGYKLSSLKWKEAGSDVDGTDILSTGNFTMPTNDVIITATFVPVYTITFDSNGGSTVESITKAAGEDIAKPADPTKENCTFAGWYKGETVYEFPSTMPAENIALTAHWTEIVSGNSVTISSSITNGTIISDKTSEVTSGSEVTLTVAPQSGYQLKTLSINDGAVSYTTSNNLQYKFNMPSSSVTVTAEFEAEATISELTTWKFDDTTAYPPSEVRGIRLKDGLYMRNKSDGTGRNFKFADSDETTAIEFSNDKIQFTPSRMAIASGKGNISNSVSTAGGTGTLSNNSVSDAIPFFAFNASVPGTVYALVKGVTGSKCRIYFVNGTTKVGESNTNKVNKEGTNEVMELKYTSSEAGSFFIGSMDDACQIYAIRFVPTHKVATSVTGPTGATATVTVKNGSADVSSTDYIEEGKTLTVEVSDVTEGFEVDKVEMNSIDITSSLSENKYSFTMPVTTSDVTITVTLKEIPTIYGTYDFRTFASSALSAEGTATPELSGNVLTGGFTGDSPVTVTGSMSLNDVFEVDGSKKTTNVKLIKGSDNTATGLQIIRGSNSEIKLLIIGNGLKTGDWFKIETGDKELHFQKVNNDKYIRFYDLDDVSKAELGENGRYSKAISGKVYVATRDISSIELDFMKDGSNADEGPVYVHSIQISNGDAIPAPTIGSYDFATGKVDITVNNSLKGQTPTVYYTTDGTNPTTSSSVYDATNKISLTEACTIKAMAYIESVGQSTVAEKEVQLEIVSKANIGDLSEGSVTITAGTTNNTTSGVTVTTYYTLDGSTPTADHNDGSFTEAFKAVAVDQTRIVKAITISSTEVSSDVVTKKIVVDAATPATTWDFVNDATLNPLTYADETYNGYYINSSGASKGDGKFKYVTNEKIHAKLSWQLEGTETANASVGENGLSITKGGRAFAINDLHVGDKIFITYSNTGETPLKTSINEDHGCSISVDGGETVSSGNTTEIASGAEIEIKSAPEGYEYLVLMPADNKITIQKIEINPVYQITGVKGSGISTLEIKTPNGKTFEDSFARGTKVTLEATAATTGGDFTWTDGDGNVLTPATSDDEGELTFTLTDNMKINVSYSTAKYWDFSEMANDDITAVTESKGLYYRGGADSRKISIADNTASTLTWNFPDGFTYTNAPKNLTLKGNGGIDLANDLTPSAVADNKSNLTLAFTTTEAGTVYVAYRVASGKNAKLYFKSATGESYDVVVTNQGDDSNNRQGILYYTAASAGNFFLGGDGDMNIYLIKFEPAATAIYTLTETVNPTDGGSVKKEIVYGDTSNPSYYESQSNTFLAGTKLKLTPAPAVGYGFSYWGDTTTDTESSKNITMDANQSVKVNFTEVKHQVTVATDENGTVALQVSGETVALTEGKAEIGEGAEVTVMATPTLFYGLSSIVVMKTGDASTTVEVTNGKFTLPDYDVTVTVTFAAEKKYSDETAKAWTFADAAETINSIVDFGDGLYLRGSSRTFTKVESGVSSVTFGDETITGITSALQTSATFNAPDAGNTSATAISFVNSASATPMIAVNAATQGTVYVAASPVADGSGQIRIYFSDGTGVPVQKVNPSIPSKDEVYTASYATDVPGTFYLGTTVAANIYAVRFVPTVTYAISKSEMTNGDVTIEPESASAGQTVTLTVVPADNYRLKSGTLKATYNNGTEQTLTIENNQFTMPAYAVTVSAEFEEIPSVYGTYDFRTWAEANISDKDQTVVVRDGSGVLTGEFTPVAEGVTIDGTMPLNGVFSIVGTKDENIANYKLRKNGTTGDAGSGLLFPRCSTGQADFIIGNLQAGDWFTIATHTNHLIFAEANEYITPLGSETGISASDELIPGRVYKVKDDATSRVSVKLCNAISGGGVSYIYSVTISKDEAISEPVISDLTDGKVAITDGSSTIGGSVKTYFTIDGSVPTASSPAYTEAVAIDQTRIVKAVTINTTTNVVSNVVTKKIVVDAATPATTWDFVNDATLNPLTYADETYNGYYINSSGASKGDGKFKYVTNEKIHAKLSWQLEGTETANASVGENGLSITKGGRAFAINDLHVGDKIFITYSNTGETPLMTSINEDHGCSISVDGGETVSSGNTTEIASGAEIEIKSAPEGYEYLVLMPADNKITIQKIEINPSFTVTNLTASDSGVTGVKVIKVDDKAVDETFASEETKSFIRGSKVTLQASYTAETGKSLLWLDAEDNELEANADGTLTLTVDADLKVKALYATGIMVTEVKNAENKMVARKLNNGLLEVTFDNNGRITAIKDIKSGKEVMASDDNNQRGYFNFNYRPSKDASVIDFGLECKSSGDIVQIGKSGSQQVELIYPTADAATPSHQTWKIGYVMKAGVSGIYTYAIMDGSSSYSELHEARYGWRVNPDIFNYAWVSDSQKGKMPTPTQMKNYVEEVQDATYKLDDGTVYTKYDWANFVKDDQLHGIMGDGIGAWLISPSAEWVNGGPQKQELTVHATDTTPIILQTMHSRHFGAGEAVLESSDDKKLFGPCLFYVNTGASQDAMIQDAKSKAAEEVGAWPYSWFTNNADIKSGLVKNESDRGGVTGKVNIDSRFGTKKVQVVLTQGNMKPLLDANGYQYYAEAAVGSNFELKNVRPGTYTLYVYALDGGATGTYSQTDVTVSAGESIDLGAIEWPTDGVGKMLWRVGNADKSTKGFKLSDEQRQYGKWQSVPETLTYTVGTSSEANDWYYAQVKNEGTWNIKFNSEESIASPLRLTIATAGASQTPKLEIKMNDNLLNSSSIALTNDAAIYRSGILGGRDSLIVLEVPAGYVQKGENTLSLKVWNLGTSVGGVMYDCIKLETLEAQPQLWDFSEWDAATKKELGVVTESKGLYYRSGTGGRSISLNKYNINAMTWNFPDGFAYSREKNEGNFALLPGNGALAPAADLTPATQLGTELKNTDDSNNRTLAFTTYGAGTVYVAYRGTAEKDYKLFFKAAGGDSYQPVVINQVDANDSNKGMLFYTAAEGGSFLLGGAANMNVYMIKFEPAETIYKLTAAVDPEDAGTIQKELVYTVGEEEKTYAATEYATAFLPKTKLALTAEANKGYKFAKWSDNTTAASTTVTMDADKTVTASFEEVSFEVDVYGVYDFRTFATENITFAEGVTDAQAIPVQEEGVMTGAFTLDETKGTVSGNTMELKNAFTLTDASNRIKLRKNSNTASTGLLMQENSSNSSMGINYLKNGDWFKIDLSGTLYFKNSYAKVKKFRGEASVQAGDAVESGAIYMISGNSTVELYNMDGGNAHIYSITISNEEFVSDPTIELKDVQGETAIYTLTFDEGSTLHYQLSTETEEQQGGTTGSYDLSITEGAKLTAWATRGAVTSGKLEVNVYAPTPAPSEEGTFDFGEASAELPADIEVTLDSKNAIVINGENFYKPTALTAATFDDKFAFSETSTDDKIKIRTNRQLTFAKGADMDMAVLNVEKGDIIAMDYTGGTIEFSASDIVTTDQSELQNASRRAVAENQALESGETYVVTGDGNIVLHLRLTSSAVNISKMVLTKVGEPTAPKALDFVNAMDNEEALETGNTVSVYVNGSNSASQFVRLANESEDLPFDGQISTQSGRGSLTTGGLKMDKNRFAIHGLALGDKILIRFYGGELTLQTNEMKGSSVSVESTGVKLQPGDALESGVVITVDKVDYLNNYIVLQGDGSCIISGIFINHDEVERIIAPSLRDRDNGLIQITPGRSTTGGEVFTSYTTDGTEPSMTNGTMGLMTEMFEVELRELYECDVTLKVVSFSRDGAMSKVVEMTVHVSGVITGIDGVPTIDGKAVDIFDMSGRKVQTMKKGQIYIIGGKKYLYK